MGDVYNAMMRSSNAALLSDPESADAATESAQWQPVAENALRLRVQPDAKTTAQFEQVRIKLLQQAAERRVQVHAFTSSLPGEGRSSCALNLAMSFAMLPNTRVLLIDMDFDSHRSILEKFDGKVTAGLKDFLNQEVRSLDQIIYPTDISNLHITPRSCARGSSESFDSNNKNGVDISGAISGAVERCRDLYDHIVIDAPAVLGPGGCAQVSKLSDEILMAVALRKTHAHELDRAKRVLQGFGCQVTGVVLTQQRK